MARTLDPALTNIDRLVEPISAQGPAGQSLRYEGTYDLAREARREDDAGLPQGVWQAELKRADWTAVESICATAIATRSKDLQLAVWLLEAWIQLDGFAGAARGLELLGRLCSGFWETMYPPLEADLTPRLAPIQWANEKLSRRLRLLPLTQPTMPGVPAYSLADWDMAMRNPGTNNSDNAVTLGKFEQSVNLTTYDWFATLRADVTATVDHVRAFDELMDQLAGDQSPGMIRFRSEAETAGHLVETMLDSARPRRPEREAEDTSSLAVPPETFASAPTVIENGSIGAASNHVPACEIAGARIRSRTEAYRLLEDIAEYLDRTDPHSPTPYLIRRAVAWGDMHFEELLPELVRDQGELSDIVKLLRLDFPRDS